MEPIDIVEVFYEHMVVGRILVYSSGRLSFVYDPKWLDWDNKFPLSTGIKPSEKIFDHEVIAPWLANLLPEESQIDHLSKVLGVSRLDTLAILKEIGGDTAGAISVGEPSVRDQWCYEPLQKVYGTNNEEDALICHFKDLRRRPFFAGKDGVRLSLAGGQEKTILSVIDKNGNQKLGLPEPSDSLVVPKRGAPSTIIIKPDILSLPGIVENEAYCLTLARLLNISAAKCAVIQVGDRLGLVVERYDRLPLEDGSVQRLHQEDFAQANGIYPFQKYEYGRIQGLDLKSLLLTGQKLSTADSLKLIDQIIFNILVANTDAHAKNYSMILSGEISLAPIYDVSSVLLWEDVDQYCAQRIAGKKRKPCDLAKRHWEKIAHDANLSSSLLLKRVTNMIDKIVSARDESVTILSDQPGVSVKKIKHISELIEENALRIAGQIK